MDSTQCLVAQWLSRRTHDGKVMRSNPASHTLRKRPAKVINTFKLETVSDFFNENATFRYVAVRKFWRFERPILFCCEKRWSDLTTCRCRCLRRRRRLEWKATTERENFSLIFSTSSQTFKFRSTSEDEQPRRRTTSLSLSLFLLHRLSLYHRQCDQIWQNFAILAILYKP